MYPRYVVRYDLFDKISIGIGKKKKVSVVLIIQDEILFQ